MLPQWCMGGGFRGKKQETLFPHQTGTSALFATMRRKCL